MIGFVIAARRRRVRAPRRPARRRSAAAGPAPRRSRALDAGRIRAARRSHGARAARIRRRRVSIRELIDDALRGLVGGLDPYSSYLDAEEYADLRVSTAGTYAGIGIEVSTADRALRVVRPFRDSPAAAAGIRSGDMISAIDGDARRRRSRCRHGAHARAARLHGEARGDARGPGAAAGVHRGTRAGGRAQRRDGRARRRLSCTRASPTFSDTTGEDFAAGIARLRRELAAKPRGVVHRPAQQPGRRARVGRRSRRPAARGRRHRRPPTAARPRRASRMAATPGDVLPGVPVVVLVNGAHRFGGRNPRRRAAGSSPRDVARPAHLRQGIGADRDAAHARAAPSSSTTSRYFTPSGRSIQGSGIEPGSAVRERRRRAARSRRCARAPDAGRARSGRARGARAAQGPQADGGARADRERGAAAPLRNDSAAWNDS